LSKALLVVGPVAGGLIAIFLVKKHYRKIKTSMQAARQRIWQFYWKTLRHPRQVSVTAKLVPKLEWILPVFIKIYNALSMQNENINTRSEPLDATVAGLIKTFSPLFESTITSTRKKSFKANARVELFSPSGISIADASMALDLAMGETKNDWWLKFNERAMRDSIREPSTWNDLAATLRIESLDSSIIIKADVKPAVIRFGAYDQMAWHSSVLKGAPFPKNFRLQDLDLLEYCALWITPEMEMMVGNRFTSERLAKAVPAFLSFFKMFNKFYEMRAKMTTSEAIFIAFGEALAKINTIFKDQGSFQIMEQIRLADELNNMQKVNPPELTVLERTGNCINLAILFCTVVEKLEQAKRLSTGILFSISENEGHVRPVLYCEGTAHAYELVRLKPIVEGSTQREGTFNLDTHGMIEDVTGLMNRLRDSPQSHPDKRLIWTEHVLDKIKKYVK